MLGKDYEGTKFWCHARTLLNKGDHPYMKEVQFKTPEYQPYSGHKTGNEMTPNLRIGNIKMSINLIWSRWQTLSTLSSFIRECILVTGHCLFN